jgi:dTDP-4-amino-4,6-dideoxygalactose transaminase
MNHKKRKRIFLSPPHMGGEEEQLVKEVFKSNYIAPLGQMVDAFEKEFAKKVGIPYTLALSSGTAAMHLALRHLGIGPGDEVFASTLTFIGSVTPIIFQGATPIFIDSDRATWDMDPDLLADEVEACAKLGKLPKAVIPTDIYGQCANYAEIFNICERYNIPVIIDAAEAMGSMYSAATATHSSTTPKYRHAGYGAKAAIYSFNGNKIITTSGGGMLVSDDKKFIDHARKLSQQAKENFIHYEHEEIGYNYRMSNILAAIGLGQLKVLEDRVEKKCRIFEYYRHALRTVPGIEFMPEASYGRSNRWLTVILITPEIFGVDRETVRMALETENIETRPVWMPMHMQPVFGGARHRAQGYRSIKMKNIKHYATRVIGGEVAEDLFNRGLCLPSGTAMTDKDLDRVIEIIVACRKLQDVYGMTSGIGRQDWENRLFI